MFPGFAVIDGVDGPEVGLNIACRPCSIFALRLLEEVFPCIFSSSCLRVDLVTLVGLADEVGNEGVAVTGSLLTTC